MSDPLMALTDRELGDGIHRLEDRLAEAANSDRAELEAELRPLRKERRRRDDYDFQAARARALTDAGNAEVFVSMYDGQALYDHLRRRWLLWGGHRWRPDSVGAANEMALESVRQRLRAAVDWDAGDDHRRALNKWALGSESRQRLEALLALARNLPGVRDDGLGWDMEPGLLGVPNGVVDLRTGELRDGRPEDRITMQAGAAYDPDALCPTWERCLREWLDPLAGEQPADEGESREAEELVRYMRRLAGYSLTAEGTWHVVPFLLGVGGNGKSTFLNLLRAAAGDYAVELDRSVLKTARFDRHSTEVSDLELSRVATCEELGDSKLDPGRLKHLSGGGSVRARRMRQDTRQFKQTWTLWLPANGLPDLDDTSHGMWRRVVALRFPRIFQQDETLEARLREELPGILAWAVRGAAEFYAEGPAEMPISVAEATAQYRVDSDPLQGLFEDGVLIEDNAVKTATAELYAAYSSWSELKEAGRLSEDAFAKAMAKRFQKARVDSRTRGFTGVAVGEPLRPVDLGELYAAWRGEGQ